MTIGKPGTLIHGTLRPQDLIPVFLDELRRLDKGAFDAYVDSNPGMLPAEIPMIAFMTPSDPWWNGEGPTWALDSLFDSLGEYSPEGHYFGAHEGDGSDFGWWEIDDAGYAGNPALPAAPPGRQRAGRAETTLDALRRMTLTEEARHRQQERPFDPARPRTHYAGAHHFAVNERELRGPVRLSNGRVVVHTRAANGSTDAHMQDGGPMSEAEWQEYAQTIKKGAGYAHLRPNAASRGEVDQHAADDLVLFIDNTASLSIDGPSGQGHSILLNALRKWKKGTYDPEQAVKLFAYLTESGARQYVKENGSSLPWNQMFNVPTRLAAAREMAEQFARRAQAGEFDDVDTRQGAR